MGIGGNTIFYILFFTSLLPALLAVRLAIKQNRSKLTSGLVAFILGFTLIGGWAYLAVMNLLEPKEKPNNGKAPE
ncbi:hypothetical protein MHM89_11380 [Pseudoalteromonas sp. CNC9-20]|uniref:hypothetical protein n=1 Tax=Pseudoalteromonas sp. CNC9-20 TaxID=2917750 RepID=UPI001EF3F70B|nr:hypothetical protein [Pseudoalteromonas sp. CNC9-20]MCG7570534.1 hypothetical protein [Pseudoalteromonas sp. CNC9-20]